MTAARSAKLVAEVSRALVVIAAFGSAAAAAAAATAGASAAAGAAPPDDGLVLVDRPIDFSAERVALTRAYLHDHYGIDAAGIEIVPKMIVVHWTGGPSLEAAFRTFAPPRLGKGRSLLADASPLNVSAHFLVARDGTAYRLMPETWMARHAVGLNYDALGVENVGGPASPLTAAQLDADEKLVRRLAARFPTIRWLIGHDESRRFEGTPLFRERDARYRTRKVDPGPKFMAALRARVADLALKSVPD
jgi:beta-N-acetylhexosaminidase